MQRLIYCRPGIKSQPRLEADDCRAVVSAVSRACFLPLLKNLLELVKYDAPCGVALLTIIVSMETGRRARWAETLELPTQLQSTFDTCLRLADGSCRQHTYSTKFLRVENAEGE
jgi:hypothetical protein